MYYAVKVGAIAIRKSIQISKQSKHFKSIFKSDLWRYCVSHFKVKRGEKKRQRLRYQTVSFIYEILLCLLILIAAARSKLFVNVT